MARKVLDEEERQKRIKLVGDYVKETGASTRKTAKYFTETFFPISNCTVSDYCVRYMKMSPSEVDIIRGKIDSNKPLSVMNEEVQKRVHFAANLFQEGLTISEVAEKLDISFWTAYRDLKIRFKTLDPVGFEEKVMPRLKDDSLNNLKRK